MADYDQYCHYVAGLVGIGLSSLFGERRVALRHGRRGGGTGGGAGAGGHAAAHAARGGAGRGSNAPVCTWGHRRAAQVRARRWVGADNRRAAQ